MYVGLLNYERGFSMEEFYHLLLRGTEADKEQNIIQRIEEKLNEFQVENIYLPLLEINPEELSIFTEELFYDIPLRLNKKLEVGFTKDMIQWMKSRIKLEDIDDTPLFLKEKLHYKGISIYIFEMDKKGTLGRNNTEHLDYKMIKMEISLDDMNPEFYGYIIEKLFDLGVNDAYVDQVIMKKNRPGQILHILLQEEIKEKITTFLFEETTTLGIRYSPVTVHRLEREFISVETKWGRIQVKVGKHKGRVVQYAPEYRQCIDIAKKHNIPLKEVYHNVNAKANQLLMTDN